MLHFLLRALLGPIKLPQNIEDRGDESRPCNVVGGCGAGCICVPEQSELSTVPKALRESAQRATTRRRNRSRALSEKSREYALVPWDS